MAKALGLRARALRPAAGRGAEQRLLAPLRPGTTSCRRQRTAGWLDVRWQAVSTASPVPQNYFGHFVRLSLSQRQVDFASRIRHSCRSENVVPLSAGALRNL